MPPVLVRKSKSPKRKTKSPKLNSPKRRPSRSPQRSKAVRRQSKTRQNKLAGGETEAEKNLTLCLKAANAAEKIFHDALTNQLSAAVVVTPALYEELRTAYGDALRAYKKALEAVNAEKAEAEAASA